MTSVTLSGLLDALVRGEMVLLPNARAARQMRAAFHARQRLHGLAAWEPARVLSWEQWTRGLWNDLIVTGAEQRLLMNAAQERSLWRQILEEDAANGTSGSVESLAELAASAWKLAGDYNASEQLRRFAGSHDSRVFAGWATTFAARCRESEVLSASLLNAALEEHARTGALAAPATVDLAGFVEMLPAQRSLLDALRACGTEVREFALEDANAAEATRVSVAAANERAELLLAARWIRGFLESDAVKEAGARLALLLPNVAERRDELEGALREILAPELQAVDADLSSTPWEFTSGETLASTAMIADAMALVRWTQGAMHRERVSSLLLSPYFGMQGSSEEAREGAARFDAGGLRRMALLRPEVEIADVVELLPRDDAEEGTKWLREVRGFGARHGDVQRPRGYAEWMELVRGILSAANWPGDRGLSAAEFEATRAWESALDTVATLDFAGRRVAFAIALQSLELQLRDTRLTLPSTDAPVKVMSVAEAEGSFFDAVVMMSATDVSWPVVERTHPLLPWTMQRSMKMPGSDPALTAARSRAMIGAVLACCGPAICMVAREDANGALRPSPLLHELGMRAVDVSELELSNYAVEEVACERAVDEGELPQLPSMQVAGGATVLKLQAACGFLAFAELRLRGRAPESGDLGLDAGERGSVLHQALQAFWKETKTQEALRLMSAEGRYAAVTRAVEVAFVGKVQARDAWDRAYLEVQKQRLRSLLLQWLPYELKRGPFTVMAVERMELVDVGPLTLDVRVDRIDAVAGGVFLVDYKTGVEIGVKQWDGPRPDEPQLPLYALLPESEELKGVGFGRLRAGREMAWVGVQAEEGILPAVRASANVKDMASLAMEWREMLDELARDFAEGRAAVLPKSFEKNCARCAQRLLCRIDPGALIDGSQNADEEGEDGLG
ncbi:MAG: PD-(D/E)XK nuclease family protein [Acidobacteriaceae bacterium]